MSRPDHRLCHHSSSLMRLGLGLIPLIRSKGEKNNLETSRGKGNNSSSGHGLDDSSTITRSKDNVGSDSVPKGVVIRLAHSPQQLHRKNNDEEDPTTAVVIGRSQLLASFHAACKNRRYGDNNYKEKRRYREAHSWAVKSNVGIQVIIMIPN